VYAFSFRLFGLHHMHSTRTPRARAPHMHFFLAFKIGLLHHCVVALLDFGKHRLLFHRPHPSFPLRTVFIVIGGFPLWKDAGLKVELWKTSISHVVVLFYLATSLKAASPKSILSPARRAGRRGLGGRAPLRRHGWGLATPGGFRL
jgi:hypothetical protein